MDDIPSFGQWLKARRKVLGLTQEELALRISCSGILIRKIEAGQRVASPDLAGLLAELLGVVPEERAAFAQFANGRLSGDAAQRKLWYTLHGHTARPHPTNLNAPLTALIGREKELQSLRDHLLSSNERLVTVTGPPGIGKTRLVVEAGMGLLDHFEDGVFFVSLSAVNVPDLVSATIAQALSAKDVGDLPPDEQLAQFLCEKRLLLVLDNFEQVLDASPFLLRLLGSCPYLKVLITSREALHVHGEQPFPMPSLATVDPDNLPPLGEMANIPAVTLFLERGRAVQPDFTLTRANARAVAAICACLEGLPLAIELAAARVKLLSPQEILSRLHSEDARVNLTVLRGRGRDLPARQRSLRSAIEWSYNLLSEWEQILFARLGVFVRGFTLTAAQAVCNADDDLPWDVMEGIELLLDKNLLKRNGGEGEGGAGGGIETEGEDAETRYSMLGVLRSYALEQLQARGMLQAQKERHARYYLRFAQEANAQLDGPHELVWLRRLDRAYENIRASIEWSISYEPAAVTAVSFAEPLNSFWLRRGYITDTRKLLNAALARAHDARSPEKARALYIAGRLASMQGDFPISESLLSQSLDLYRELGDRAGIGTVLQRIGVDYLRHRSGDPEPARRALEEGLALTGETGSEKEIGEALGLLGHFTQELGDHVTAQRYFAASLALARQIADRGLTGSILLSLGEIARIEGDLETARSIYQECVALFEASGANLGRAHALHNLAKVALATGDAASARPLLAESLALFQHMGNKSGLYHCIAAYATLHHLEGDASRGISLFSFTQAAMDRKELTMERADWLEFERYLAMARARADDSPESAAWEIRQNLTLEQAIVLALA